MARGHALLVGLKEIDANIHGWNGKNGCSGCELDVDNMNRILKAEGYRPQVLKTRSATCGSILSALRKAAEDVASDDIFVFYFSGHGGSQPDRSSPRLGDESDGRDETLIAYDGEIVDDHLDDIWLAFREGARIVMISDSCNSGTNYKNTGTVLHPSPIVPIPDPETAEKMAAQLIHYGGCRDGWTSTGYLGGGAFTMALCTVWADGRFEGSYRYLLDCAAGLVTSGQIPQYNEYGPVSDRFRSSRPFRIEDQLTVSMHLRLGGGDIEAIKHTLMTDLGSTVWAAIERAGCDKDCSVAVSGSVSSQCGSSVSGSVTCTF